MPLERLFLYLVVAFAALWAAMMLTSFVAILPYGLPGLAVLAFVAYILWRLVREHTSNAEDRYYEDNFDK